MSKQELIRAVNKKFMKKAIPIVKPGYTVRVVSKFRELPAPWSKDAPKERTQSFEWLVIKVRWKSWDLNSTITVRKISEWIWVEKVFPVHSPNIVSIENLKIAKIRRSKLYYMRDRFWKSARLKEVRLTQAQKDDMIRDFGKDSVIEVETVAKDSEDKQADVIETQVDDTVEAKNEEVTPEEKTDVEEVKAEEVTEAKAEEVTEAKVEEKAEEAPKEKVEEVVAEQVTEEEDKSKKE